MHVPRADLKAVRIFFDHRKIARVHDFSYDRQLVSRGLRPEIEVRLRAALESVRRRAWLECAARKIFAPDSFTIVAID